MTTLRGVLISEDSQVSIIEDPVTSEAGKLGVLYQRLACHSVDRVELTEGVDLWVDDEGLIASRPFNHLATTFALAQGRPTMIFGHALVLGFNDEGETLPLDIDRTGRVAHTLGVSRQMLTRLAGVTRL
ncbi:hypothetical protein SEA_OBLADI_124 [Gordonia phage ObLaDi]|uniref:DUF3846 domain-containing protein n=2 Tax=Cafassovirus TaxID=3425056 RepID=A0A9E7QC12_9CAUD|nr:hypothetical protein SEA_ALEEMILY_123 [Gordonia phage Aleemily]UXE03847.1 hypothetical protein SEA_OBLADI_124 [Gordonia phage ObLaDi]